MCHRSVQFGSYIEKTCGCQVPTRPHTTLTLSIMRLSSSLTLIAASATALSSLVDADAAADIPLLRGTSAENSKRRRLNGVLDLNSICEAPTVLHNSDDGFIPAAFFDGSYFTFTHRGSSHSFLVGPRGEVQMPVDADKTTVSLGTFSHYNHISPAATYANGDEDDTCPTDNKRRDLEVYFIIDRSENTDISFHLCEPVPCHFHILVGVPEAQLFSFGYHPGPTKILGLGPFGRKPFLPQIDNYDICPSVLSLPNSFPLPDQESMEGGKSAVDYSLFQCAMDVVVPTEPGTCQATVSAEDYPTIMTRSDEYSAPFATSCDPEETVHEPGDQSTAAHCNTFAWDKDTRSFQDVFSTEINVAAVDVEPPKIRCPMIAVDMSPADTFSSLSIMSEDNCGPSKVFCSRPIRSNCSRLNQGMFERPKISQDQVAPEQLGLRPGTYCFSCVAADSSLNDENGDPIYDEEIANGLLDERKAYLYRDVNGNWKSGQPSDRETGLLYSGSRVSRVSEPCLVQVNVISS